MTYGTIWTTAGLAAKAAADAGGAALDFHAMVVGDGNGAATTPEESDTALVNQVHAFPFSQYGSVYKDPKNTNQLLANIVIPNTIGGWTIREAGIVDSSGTLLVIANVPATLKEVATNGAPNPLPIQMIVAESNSTSVTVVDGSASLYATQAYVGDQIAELQAEVNPFPVYAKETDLQSLSTTLSATTGVANQAEQDAQTAITAAAAAQTKANTAESDAQQALANAATADGAALAAQSTANQAQTTATTAQSAATAAQSTANQAETDAQTGIRNAATANSLATAAQTSASSAQTTANQAESDAQAAIAAAAAAQTTANEALANAASAALAKASNLSDLANFVTARANLDVYSTEQIDSKLSTISASVIAAMTQSSIETALGFVPVNSAIVGAANGIAQLGTDGRLLSSQIPSSLLGAVVYQGVWNASTNTPALASGVGTKGYYYKVSTAGSTTVDGISTWNVGDTIIFNGTTYDKIDGIANELLSFNGRTGAISLTSADVVSALGFTPLANTSAAIAAVLGYTPVANTAAALEAALGFTPYNATNPNGYISGNQTITVTGDVTGSGSTALALTLSNTGVAAGTYTKVTVDAKGRVSAGTALSSTDVSGALGYTPLQATVGAIVVALGYNPVAATAAAIESALGFTPINAALLGAKSGVAELDSNGYLLPAEFPGLTGDVTVAAGSLTATLAASGIAAGTYGVVTVDAKGRATAGRALASADVTAALGFTPISTALEGVAGGVATLDSNGKIPTSQLPASVLGAENYQGTWNASTNTPTLASGTGTKGYFYKVSVAGTTTLDGVSSWSVNDFVTFDGTTWDKIDGQSTEVGSFNGRIGAVTLTSSDVTTALGFTPATAAAASQAESDAQTAITNAATAQTKANTAETDAQTGITNAAAAQTSANSALTQIANAVTQLFNGVVSVSVTGYTSLALSAAQLANATIKLTGVTTAATTIVFPLVGNWIVENQTTGGYAVTAQGATGTGIALPNNGSMVVYGDGTNINGVVGQSACYVPYEFTATANQTTFNLNYAPNLLQAFVQGRKLPASDFTATNGSTVVFPSGTFAGGENVSFVAWYGYSSTNATLLRVTTEFTATASQASFSQSGFSYIPGLVDVFVNGVKYGLPDFTATDGLTVTMTTPSLIPAGALVQVVAYLPYNIANCPTLVQMQQSQMGANGITSVSAVAVLTTSVMGQMLLLKTATQSTLPSASTFPAGYAIQFVSMIAGATVVPAGTDGIYSGATKYSVLTFGNSDTAILKSDGVSAWYIAEGSMVTKVAMSNFSVYQSSAQTITAGAWNALNFQTATFDDLGEFTLGTAGKFTAVNAGTYVFTGAVLGSSTTAGTRALAIYVNGVLKVYLASSNSNGNLPLGTTSGPIKLNAGDYVQLYYNPAVADTLIASSIYTFFGGYRVK